MIPDERSPQEVWTELIHTLEILKASELSREIRTAIEKDTFALSHDRSRQPRTRRPMDPTEQLAVVLEHILSVLAIPIMLADAKTVLGAREIAWMPDRLTPQDAKVEFSSQDATVAQMDPRSIDILRHSLPKVTHLAKQLGVCLPEVA